MKIVNSYYFNYNVQSSQAPFMSSEIKINLLILVNNENSFLSLC